jgi:hypothetical protein
MSYHRLIVALDEDGWVTFRLAEKPPGEQSQAEFQLPKGFSLDDVLEAARATGWLIDRQGIPWIDQQTGCAFLADFVVAILYYFDGSQKPSKRLMAIQAAVEEWLADENAGDVRLSPWVCAWLDLIVRDDAKEDVLTAEDVWRKDSLQVDLAKHRQRRLRQVLQRLRQAEPAEAEAAEIGRMAPSQRSRLPAEQRRRDVG